MHAPTSQVGARCESQCFDLIVVTLDQGIGAREGLIWVAGGKLQVTNQQVDSR